MKKFSIIAALVIAAPGLAQAQNYFEPRAGGMLLADDSPSDGADAAGALRGTTVSFDTGWAAAIAVGRDFAGPLRAEIEYSHRTADVGAVTGSIVNPTPPPPLIPFTGAISGDVAIDAVLLNGYVDTPFTWGAVYVGLGVGVAFTDTEFDGLGNSDVGFGWQVVTGVSYSVTPTIDLTAGYSLFVVEGVPLGNSEIDATTHSLLVGARVGF